MEIRDKFDKIKSVIDMHDFMQDIKTEVSFWGCRYVTKKDHIGYLSIDDLAKKMFSLAKSLHYEYTSHQEEIGDEITKRITALYKENDNLVKQRNLITRLFVLLKDIFIILKEGIFSNVRRRWFIKTINCGFRGI